jgi:hypothetical protein
MENETLLHAAEALLWFVDHNNNPQLKYETLIGTLEDGAFLAALRQAVVHQTGPKTAQQAVAMLKSARQHMLAVDPWPSLAGVCWHIDQLINAVIRGDAYNPALDDPTDEIYITSADRNYKSPEVQL